MVMFAALIRHINRQFDDDHIEAFARNAGRFAPGQHLNVDVLRFPDAALARHFQTYLNNLPGSLQEVLRCLFSRALSASPPIPITFSWAPGYDYQINIWEPECGILVQFISPKSHSGEGHKQSRN